MPRIKSLVTRVEIDQAKKAHNCQANSNHRVEAGDTRLKVKNQRSWDHYCLECARSIVNKDMKKLSELLTRLN